MARQWSDSRHLSRRHVLQIGAAAAVSALAAGWAYPLRASVATHARIVIVGAGAGGLAVASRLSRALDGARLTIVDSRQAHWYQPGFTLVAGGVWEQGRVVFSNRDYLPAAVDWVQAMAAEYHPEANYLVTTDGQKLVYDYLIVATGLTLDYEQIEGMSRDLIGRHGIGSVYASPEGAAATWLAMLAFAAEGGVGLFGRPPGDIKCAGAPLKMALLTDYRLRDSALRQRTELVYNAHNDSLFGVPLVADKVNELFDAVDIRVNYDHVLTGIDPGARLATYATPDGPVRMDYDFIHVVPPMSPPDSLQQSELAWREGPFAAKGWLEVDKYTLQHARFPNVFGIGDVNGIPKGKTAASVKAQAPVLVRNLSRVIQGAEPDARYNGYTSCPLVTRVGQAMLVEFDYENNLIPSFPFIDPLKPQWSPWLLEELMLKPAYTAVLRGRA